MARRVWFPAAIAGKVKVSVPVIVEKLMGSPMLSPSMENWTMQASGLVVTSRVEGIENVPIGLAVVNVASIQSPTRVAGAFCHG